MRLQEIATLGDRVNETRDYSTWGHPNIEASVVFGSLVDFAQFQARATPLDDDENKNVSCEYCFGWKTKRTTFPLEEDCCKENGT